MYQSVEGIPLRGDMVDALTIHSKDAHGPKEHAGPGIGPLLHRVHELQPPLDVPVSVGHNS